MLRRLALLTLMSLSGVVLAQAPPKANSPALGEPWARSLSASFAFDFYRATLAEKEAESFCCSPHSAMCALAMLSHGASGKGRDEFARMWPAPESAAAALRWEWPSESLLLGLHSMNRGLQTTAKARVKMVEELAKLEKEIESIPSGVRDPFGGIVAGTPADHKRRAAKLERIDELKGDLSPVDIAIASAIWVDKTFPLNGDYVEVAGRKFGAVIEPANFVRESRKEIDRINAWCSEKTRGKIERIVDEQSVHDATRVILTNAVYFNALWESPFKRELTKKEKFDSIDGNTIAVEMMRGEKRAKYAEFRPVDAPDGFQFRSDGGVVLGSKWDSPDQTGGWKVLELPYKGGRFSFIAVLPNDQQGLEALESSMTRESFDLWRKELKTQMVFVAMPRFRLDSDFDLKPILKTLGLNAIFEMGSLRGFSDGPESGLLYLETAVQKTFIDVHEEGTEAAAVTALGGVAGGGPSKPPPEFIADHPFVYLIRDNKTGVVLFMGRFTGSE